MSHIASFCAGAIVALLFALWMITKRKPPGITKHARREKPVDVPHTEYRRRYRDLPLPETVPEWGAGGRD
jgi:hypothetical protein